MLLNCYKNGLVEAGCDEVGRGCLAGPVVAAAVIFPPDYQNGDIRDSKKLTFKKRLELREVILKDAVDYGIGLAGNDEIDEVNILRATFLAMHRAISNLRTRPEMILVDGNRFMPFEDIPYHCQVGGDNLYLAIAGASILAKTYRDLMMMELAGEFPGYGWDRNFGYPTKLHRQAIQEHGTTPLHRKSFRLLKDQLDIF